MADEQTLELLSALATGCDPRTGIEFEPTHVLRRKEVTKALNDALKAMGSKPSKRPRRPIVKSDYFAGTLFNRLSAKSRKELAERVLSLPVSYPLGEGNSRVVRTEHARSQEPWKRTEQELLARVLPHTNDLKFLSIIFQRSENAIQMETRRLMAERMELRGALNAKVAHSVRDEVLSEEPKTYSVAKLREKNPHAYARWTEEDDAQLEQLYCAGKKNKELAKIFGRDPGAIASRIKKLELKEKYSR